MGQQPVSSGNSDVLDPRDHASLSGNSAGGSSSGSITLPQYIRSVEEKILRNLKDHPTERRSVVTRNSLEHSVFGVVETDNLPLEASSAQVDLEAALPKAHMAATHAQADGTKQPVSTSMWIRRALVRTPIGLLLRLQDATVVLQLLALVLTCTVARASPAATAELAKLQRSSSIADYHLTYMAVAVGVAAASLLWVCLRIVLRTACSRDKTSSLLHLTGRNGATIMFLELVFYAAMLSESSAAWGWTPESGVLYFNEDDYAAGLYSATTRVVWPIRPLHWAATAGQMVASIAAVAGLPLGSIALGYVLTLLTMLCSLGADMYPLHSAGQVFWLTASCLSAFVMGILAVQAGRAVFSLVYLQQLSVRIQIYVLTTLTVIAWVLFPMVYLCSRYGAMTLRLELILWPMLECVSKALLLALCVSVAELYSSAKSHVDRVSGNAMLSTTSILSQTAHMESVHVLEVVESAVQAVTAVAAANGITFQVEDYLPRNEKARIQPQWYELVVTAFLTLAMEAAQPGSVIRVMVATYSTSTNSMNNAHNQHPPNRSRRGQGAAAAAWIQLNIISEGQEVNVEELGLKPLLLSPGEFGPANRLLSPDPPSSYYVERTYTAAQPEQEAEGDLATRVEWCCQLMAKSHGYVGIRSSSSGIQWVVDVSSCRSGGGGGGAGGPDSGRHTPIVVSDILE